MEKGQWRKNTELREGRSAADVFDLTLVLLNNPERKGGGMKLA